MLENKFQSEIIKRIKENLPGAIILKNDPTYKQGIPDLVIFYKNKWACLECKKSVNASHRPNQDYYIDTRNLMSFARFIFPENSNDVLKELFEYLK